MRLTQQQQQDLIVRLNKLSEKGVGCFVCHNTGWNIADTIFEFREFQGGNMVLGGDSRIYPVVPMTCMNCGNTIFLNAIQFGLVNTLTSNLTDAKISQGVDNG